MSAPEFIPCDCTRNACPVCAGSGRVDDVACLDCGGSGVYVYVDEDD